MGRSPKRPKHPRSSRASSSPTIRAGTSCPICPRATYQVFVRGYGLVDSPRVKAKPGQPLDLKAVVPTPKAAAQVYPAGLVDGDDESPRARPPSRRRSADRPSRMLRLPPARHQVTRTIRPNDLEGGDLDLERLGTPRPARPGGAPAMAHFDALGEQRKIFRRLDRSASRRARCRPGRRRGRRE